MRTMFARKGKATAPAQAIGMHDTGKAVNISSDSWDDNGPAEDGPAEDHSPMSHGLSRRDASQNAMPSVASTSTQEVQDGADGALLRVQGYQTPTFACTGVQLADLPATPAGNLWQKPVASNYPFQLHGLVQNRSLPRGVAPSLIVGTRGRARSTLCTGLVRQREGHLSHRYHIDTTLKQPKAREFSKWVWHLPPKELQVESDEPVSG